jgi:hypothetical protein
MRGVVTRFDHFNRIPVGTYFEVLREWNRGQVTGRLGPRYNHRITTFANGFWREVTDEKDRSKTQGVLFGGS